MELGPSDEILPALLRQAGQRHAAPARPARRDDRARHPGGRAPRRRAPAPRTGDGRAADGRRRHAAPCAGGARGTGNARAHTGLGQLRSQRRRSGQRLRAVPARAHARRRLPVRGTGLGPAPEEAALPARVRRVDARLPLSPRPASRRPAGGVRGDLAGRALRRGDRGRRRVRVAVPVLPREARVLDNPGRGPGRRRQAPRLGAGRSRHRRGQPLGLRRATVARQRRAARRSTPAPGSIR